MTGTVERDGYVSMKLHFDIKVDVGPNQAIRISNPRQGAVLTLSGCGTQMAMEHPKGRVVQYYKTVEIQTSDGRSKSAKMTPRGVSFSSLTCALTYLVDQAGVRTMADNFHDLLNDNTVNSKKHQISRSRQLYLFFQSFRDLLQVDQLVEPDPGRGHQRQHPSPGGSWLLEDGERPRLLDRQRRHHQADPGRPRHVRHFFHFCLKLQS